MLPVDRTYSAWSTSLWKTSSKCELVPNFYLFLYPGHRATGVTTAVVERIEETFKKDILREVRAAGGRILLHDEVEERPGVFSIIPIWEQVGEEDIMTPRNVFELMAKEGYHVRILFSRILRRSDWLVRTGGL